MTTEQERDGKRWTVYENILKPDSGSADNERKMATDQLAALKLKYPGGNPAAVPKPDPFAGFRGTYSGRYTAYEDFWKTYDWRKQPTPEEQRAAQAAADARAAAARETARVRAVTEQRKQVANVPDWWSVEPLRELHRADSAWSTEDKIRFKQVSRPQWETLNVDLPSIFVGLAKVTKETPELGEYQTGQMKAILNYLAGGLGAVTGPQLHTGHFRWLERACRDLTSPSP